VSNPRGAECLRFDRVSIHANKDEAFFFEIEVMPRLRAVRNRLSGSFESARMARKDAFGSRWGGTARG